MFEESVDREEATADTNLNVILLNLDHDLLGAELVDTLRLSHEHDLELASFGVVVDVLGEASVDGILLDGNVDSDSLLEVNDVLLKRFNFDLSILKLLEKFERSLVGSVDLLLELKDVLGGLVELLLKHSLLSGQLGIESLRSSQLGLDVLLLGNDLLERDNGGLQAVNPGLQLLDRNVLAVDRVLRGGTQILKLRLEIRDLSILGHTHLFAFGRQAASYIFELGSEISSYLLTLSGQSGPYLFLLLVHLLLLTAPLSFFSSLSLLLLLELVLQSVDLVDELLLVGTMSLVVNLDGLRSRDDVLLELNTLLLGLSESSLSALDVSDVIVDDVALSVEALDGCLETLDLNLLLGHNHLGVVGLLSDDLLVLSGSAELQ